MMRRVIILAILLALGARAWWRWETEAALGGPAVTVVIASGTSVQGIGDQLAAAGVLPRSWTFLALVRLRGDASRLKAGRYRFEGPYSMLDVEQKLASGEVERREVTFPEGRSMFEMAELVTKVGLSNEAFLAAAKDPALVADIDSNATSLEGYLFPETYDIQDGATEASLIAEMVKHTKRVLDELGLAPGGRTIAGEDLTLRQIVTLASIVELETAAPAERPHIAGVFLNRLRVGMRLQTDPTVIYMMKLQGQYRGNIRKVDLESNSPYNTYQVAGLPPGPIGSPGRSALEAVLNPESTEDLYFVSRNDGTHVFSKSLGDHERAVDEYQRRRSGRSAAPSTSPAPKASPTK